MTDRLGFIPGRLDQLKSLPHLLASPCQKNIRWQNPQCPTWTRITTRQVWTQYLEELDSIPGRDGLYKYLAGLDLKPGRVRLNTWQGWTLYLKKLHFIPGRAGLFTWQGWT
jgi:hypothetical protein